MNDERITAEELDILNDVKREVDMAVAAAQRLLSLVSARLVRKYNLTSNDRIEEDGTIVRKKVTEGSAHAPASRNHSVSQPG